MDDNNSQKQTELGKSQSLQPSQSQSLEPADPQTCIVLHPGSRFLRLGRPSDSVPFTVLHAIAWRMKDVESPLKRTDPLIVSMAKMNSEQLQEIEECRLRTTNILQNSLKSDGSQRFGTSAKQLSSHNKRVTPTVDENSAVSPSLLNPSKKFIVGDQVCNLAPEAPYHIHFPWQRGQLNIQPFLPGGTVEAVKSDLQHIWTWAIETKLRIPASDFSKYQCCVVVPDLYHRDQLVHITDVLLSSMGFAACFVFQDHVAATFGCGLGSACVVDIGDQKTSVSCVDEGLSVPASRIRLQYGGGDVCQVLHWLLHKSGFPRALQPETCGADAALVYEVKHTACHLSLDRCGPEEHKVRVLQPGSKALVYNLLLADELILAPLAYSYPGLLQLTGDKSRVLVQAPNLGHHEDPFDENYLRETSRRGAREASDPTEPLASVSVASGQSGDVSGPMDEEASSIAPVTMEPEDMFGTCGGSRASTECSISALLSIEQAIATSIERCNEDLRRRMYSTILVVGGGANFALFSKWLESRLVLQIPLAYRPEQVDIIVRPKDQDPDVVAWKGAALMTGLEGSGELWISNALWNKMGVKALREKCPFNW